MLAMVNNNACEIADIPIPIMVIQSGKSMRSLFGFREITWGSAAVAVMG